MKPLRSGGNTIARIIQMPSWHVGNYWTPENPDAFLPRYAGYYAPFYGGHKNANTRYLMNAAIYA